MINPNRLSKKDFLWLEGYYWRLVRYINGPIFNSPSYIVGHETVTLTVREREELLYEVAYIEMTISILSSYYNHGMKSSKHDLKYNQPVVAKPINSEKDPTTYYFSCPQVGADVMGTSSSKIGDVCRGVRRQAAGCDWWTLKKFEESAPKWLKAVTFEKVV